MNEHFLPLFGIVPLTVEPQEPPPSIDLHGWFGIYVFLSFSAVFGGFLLFKSKAFQKRQWNRGLIPMSLKPTPQNLFEVYIAAGTAVLIRDLDGNSDKYPWLANYLKNRFGEYYRDYRESFMYSYNNVLKLDGLVNWCNKHLDETEKIHLIEFLTLLGDSDGELVENERLYLIQLMDKLGLMLPQLNKEVQGLLEKSYAQRRRERAEQLAPQSTRIRHLKKLGLEEGASEQEIKTAFRALAKLTHPDRFIHASVDIQEGMKQKFQSIQAAYDALLD